MTVWIGRSVAVVLAGWLLSGCVITDQALLPVLTGEFRPTGHGAPAADDPVFGMGGMAPRSAPIVVPVADAAALDGRHQPLAIIRFADPDIDFDAALRATIQHALSGKPDAGFGLVAVSATGADATLDAAALQRNIERVLAAMTKAGVAKDRVIFTAASATDGAVDEVRVYLLDLDEAQ